MNKTKVLEVAFPALNNSGVPAVIMGIVRNLHSSFDFDVLVFRREAGYHENEFLTYGGQIQHIDLDKTGNMIIDLFEKLLRPIRLYRNTRKILRAGSYDVIHCHNGFDSCWCLLAAKKENVKVRVVHSHASVNPFEKNTFFISLYEKLARRIINKCSTHRIGCSQIAGDRLYGIGNTTDVLVNAVDLSKFNLALYPRKKYDPKAPSFIFIGRLTEQKNPIFIISLFKKIVKQIPLSTLTIVGFGPLKDTIKKKIIEENLENSVSILPHSSDVPCILSKSDFFLMPSFFEGLPIVLVEAQAMGVYAFVSDSIASEANLGLCEYITICEGVNVWEKKIMDLLNSGFTPSLPNKDTLEKYSWGMLAQKYANIYQGKD